jgi:hypothetical protein
VKQTKADRLSATAALAAERATSANAAPVRSALKSYLQARFGKTAPHAMFLDDEKDFLLSARSSSSEAADLAQKIVAKASERDAQGTEWALEHHVYGEKQTEIAEEAGVNVETVRKRIQRVMAFMRKYGSTIAMVLMMLFCAISALAKCDAKLWEECVGELDAAKAEDPEGDLAPEVVRARAEAAQGLMPSPLELKQPTDDQPHR